MSKTFKVKHIYGSTLHFLHIFWLELGSMVGRMRLRWTQRPYRVAGFPVYRQSPDRHLEPCTDSLACMNDTGNFFSNRDWATLIDVQTYQAGWRAGAKWAASNPDSYSSRWEEYYEKQVKDPEMKSLVRAETKKIYKDLRSGKRRTGVRK